MPKIIYPIENGRIAVIHPAPNSELAIKELARKDVPAGTPFLIVEDDDLPTDRTFRDAWEANFSTPHGKGLGHDAWVAMNAKKGKRSK